MPEQLTPGQFRRVMGRFATGVTIVTVQHSTEMHGMTANAFCSLSLEPLLVMICLSHSARMLAFVRDAGAFAVNILRADQEALARHFAGRRGLLPPEFRFVPWEGGPRLEGCLGALGCTVERMLEAGDHTLVVGRVHALHEDAEEGEPLIFWGGQYHLLQRRRGVPGQATEHLGAGSARIYYDMEGDVR